MPFDTQKAKKHIEQYLHESAEVVEKCIAFQNEIIEASQLLVKTFNSGNKVLIAGNGGSAADAQHIAGEFISLLRTTQPRKGLPAISIPTNVPMLTASANDFDFNQAMARCVDALGNPGDILWGISTSGTSTNVVEAIKHARHKGMKVITFTGETENPMSELSDITFQIPCGETPKIQQGYMAVAHMICDMVDWQTPQREDLPEIKDVKSVPMGQVLKDIKKES